ncbi:10227_t:CDS:2 [Funneliformis mosseae]|uniref:10227_t:CDS:1 n=1 Tax=Funneliformis mosseae TaxID=27381 RepID=A0A9N9BHC8_FUNMO|nr:10227_t:CDS:2 [Funneliformis mosseae]
MLKEHLDLLVKVALHEAIAELFEISKSTVGDILNNKEKWLAVAENSVDVKKNVVMEVNGHTSNYINIDFRIEIAEVIDEDEIIAAVQGASEEEETISIPISYPIALDSIKNLFDYLQQNSDIKVNSPVISGMRDL